MLENSQIYDTSDTFDQRVFENNLFNGSHFYRLVLTVRLDIFVILY